MESVNFEYLPIIKVNVLLFNNKITSKMISLSFQTYLTKLVNLREHSKIDSKMIVNQYELGHIYIFV